MIPVNSTIGILSQNPESKQRLQAICDEKIIQPGSDFWID
jgi:hypothetical protein